MKQMRGIIDLIKNETEYRKRCAETFIKSSYGEKNKYKKFRILCNRSQWAGKQGLISTIFEILPNIIEARQHNYIPVIDLCQNSRCQILLQEKQFAKQENAWEYYFTQPDKEILLKNVWKSMYVEKQIKPCRNNKYYIGDECFKWDAKAQILASAICQNIHLKKEIKDRLIYERNRLFKKKEKILGVAIRAGYRSGVLRKLSLYNGHPLVGSCIDYIRDIEKKLSSWKYNSFFLEVDDRKYLEEIKKYFGDVCIYLERPRFNFFQNVMEDIPYLNNDDIFAEFKEISIKERNIDYLVELYLLAYCDSLFASRGTGQNFAYLLNNGRYSQIEFVDFGEFYYQK